MDLRDIVGDLAFVALFWALLAASARDIAAREIPNECVAAVVAARLVSVVAERDVGHAAAASVEGAACVLAFLLAVRALAWRVFGSAGIGAGDVKLWSALGLWAGPVGGLAVVGASCVIALACHAAVPARDRASFRPGTMPMAPSIALAMALVTACGVA